MPDRHGPYRNNRFIVEINDIAIMGFSRVRLPEATAGKTKYREGNDPPTSQKLKDINYYNPLILEKGITDDSIALYEWFKQVEQGKLGEARRTIAVVILDEEGQPGPRWEFRQAWPARYTPPTLDATDGYVAVETIEIVHEGMERVA